MWVYLWLFIGVVFHLLGYTTQSEEGKKIFKNKAIFISTLIVFMILGPISIFVGIFSKEKPI
jgi:hypothetical protein